MATAALAASTIALQAQIPGPNVNMVSGTTLPDGDPFLQRQNEPSAAVSSRNPLHLLAGSNDYRTVDYPGIADDEEAIKDAWLSYYLSPDGGQTWKSTLIPGFPQDTSAIGKASPIHGFDAGADPVVRAGTNGLFYYTGLAFNRVRNGLGAIFVSRLIDNNNVAGGNSIVFLETKAIDSGTAGQFIDKPYVAVDIPRAGALTCTIQAPGTTAPQKFTGGTVYIAYIVAVGTDKNAPVTRMMLTRSRDCGATWTKPIKVSERVHVNQGATMTIDPTTGALYLAWREIADTSASDGIVVAKSTDFGQTFTKPAVVATIKPFDQGGGKSTFRTRAYPTMTSDGGGRVYLAWSERGWGPPSPLPAGVTLPAGDARIVMMTSRDGVTWTPRQAIDNDPNVRGHQIMPSITATAGKVTAIYYDFRDDVSKLWELYIDDSHAHAPGKRHTVDVRVTQANPADVPAFVGSVKLSQYLTGFRTRASNVKEQLQFNAPNLPLYGQGKIAFIGDYIDVIGQNYVKDANGNWKFNTSSDGPATAYGFWTDNRDVRPPRDGDWTHYTPVNMLNTLTHIQLASCQPGQTGMRNANIYTARITPGLVVGAPVNSKRLGSTQKSFVVFAQNNTDAPREGRRYTFTILNQPPGGKASFLQTPVTGMPDPLTTLDVTVAPRSTGSRVVYVTSSDPAATVKVSVVEVPNPKTCNPTCAPPLNVQGTIVLNPDVTNPDTTNPDVTNNEVFAPDVTNPDVTNPDVTNFSTTAPDVTNTNLTNPDVTNPDVTNVSLANPDVTNPDVTNGGVPAPDVTNPDVTNPDVTNPDVTNNTVTNPSLSDVSWTVKNSGTATGSFSVKTFLAKNAPPGFIKQLILHKQYKTPVTTNTGQDDCTLKSQTQNVLVANIVNPDVTNIPVGTPDVTNPDVTNATLALAPGESAKITLRVVNPDIVQFPVVTRTVIEGGQTLHVTVPVAFDASQEAAPVVVSQAVSTGGTTPPTSEPLIITTQSLPDGMVTAAYVTASNGPVQLTSTGGVGTARTWSVVPSSIDQVLRPLPFGLSLDAATGIISGVPTTAGSFPFTVQVMDAATPTPHVNTQDLFILIAPFAVTQTVTTNEDTFTDITLTAIGADPSALTFSIATQPTHGALSGSGANVRYTPSADYFGGDSFTFTALLSTPQGNLVSLSATVSITVNAVNDPPSFTANPVPSSLEDAGPQSVPNAATNFSPGPANESTQTVLAYHVTSNTNPALFSAGPAIDNVGTLTYTAAPNANGSATITVTVQDTGGTSGGGSDTSAPQTFTITVTPVNDAPSFTANAVPAVNEDAGPQTVPNAATNFSPGPANESTQAVLAYHVTSNTNPSLFSAGPAIDNAGTLTYTPAANANGTAMLTVTVQDTGGTDNGGVDTSAPQAFVIRVSPVNDKPMATPQSASTNEGTAVAIVLAGTDIETAAGNLTFAIVTPPAHGVLTGTPPNVTYTPNANYSGPDSFAFTVTDRGDPDTCSPVAPGVCTAPLTSDPATVSITVIPVATLPCTPAPSGLISWWPGEGNANDITGGNNATLQGGVSFVSGEVGQAFQFNGVDGYVSTGPAANLNPLAALSIDAWINPTQYGATVGTGVIAGRPFGYQLNLLASGQIRFAIVTGGVVAPYIDSAVVPIHAWTHVAGVYDGAAGTIQVYVNGALQGTAAAPAQIDSMTKPFQIGGFNDPGFVGGFFSGAIDEVQLFSRALTAAEIQAIANAGSSGVCKCDPEPSGLVSWWPGDAGATDIRGGNNGQLYGATSLVAGEVGQAFEFSTDPLAYDHVRIPPAPTLVMTSAMTMSAWIRSVRDWPYPQVVVSKEGEYQFGRFPDGTIRWAFGNDPGFNWVNTGYVVPLNTWTHVAVTFDAGVVKTYANGALVHTSAGSGAIGDANPAMNDLYISGRQGVDLNWFKGDIDEVQIFNRALTAAEIQAIVASGGAGVCQDRPPVPTNDSTTTTTGNAVTIAPSANDTDPNVAFLSVLATVRGGPLGTANLALPSEVAVVAATGLAYFGGGNLSAATPGQVGIIDTNTNTVTGVVTLPVPGLANLGRVNQTTKIVYFRVGTTLEAIDGNPTSLTFNQAILSLGLGTIQSMAIDETHGRLYVTNQTTASAGNLFQSRLTVIDVNPANQTFHQVIQQLAAPGGGTAQSVGVNATTNKVYVAVTGSTNGVYVVDGTTFAASLIASTANASTLVVNDSANLVYAAGTFTNGSALVVIDGLTASVIGSTVLPVTSTFLSGAIDTRLAVHKGTGHVYLRAAEFPNSSRLFLVDGNRASGTFNTILTTLALGREDGTTMVAVDEGANRVIATSQADLKSTVVDAVSNAVIGTISATQPRTRIAIDTTHHRAYVIGGPALVQAIDLAAGTLQGIVPVGVEVIFPAINTITHTAYVPQTATSTSVGLVNETGQIGTVTGLPHGDGRLSGIVRNSLTNKIYVVNANATAAGGSDALPGFVSVIDGGTNAVVANVPVGPFPFLAIGVNETTNKIYVGNNFDGAAFPGGITVINGADNSTVQADISQLPTTSTTPGQVSFVRSLVVNAATGKVYGPINTGSTATIAVLDGATNVVTPLPASLGPVNIIRVNPVLNRIYVGGQVAGQANQIHVLNGANDQEIATLTLGSPTLFIGTQSYMAVNRTTSRVFVTDFNQDSLLVIDGTTNAVMTIVHVGHGPSTVAVNETTNRVYVGNAYDKSLTIIDGATLRVAAALALPLTPVRFDVDETVSRIFATGAQFEPGLMVISDPGTRAPPITSVTQGAHGTTTLNADGTVTYTPNSGFSGVDSYTYTESDGLGGTATGTVNVTVNAALSITTTTLPNSQVGQSYSQTLAATGGTAPYVWAGISGVAPGGLVLNSTTGLISGLATQSGTYAFTIQVHDSGTPVQTATQTYTINVGPPVVTTTSLPNATINQPYSQQLTVGGATGAVTWTLNTNNSPLLSWMALSSAGVLSGTPPNYGTTPSFTVTATDALNQVASRALTLFVGGALDIVPTTLREGVVLETEPSLPIVGGNGTKSVTLTAGSLPPGVTLTSTGAFTGSPTRHGTFNFTVQVQDCALSSGLPTCTNQVAPQTVTRALTWRVSPKDQQGSSSTQPAISFGGLGGRRIAQTVTVGAQGTLTGIGLRSISCPSFGPVTAEIQRLTLAGLPDGTTIASGTAINNLNAAIAVSPPVDLPIDAKFAFIISSPTACTLTNAATTDNYNAGDAYVNSGSGWASLFSTDGRYDVPSFVTLIQPAIDVAYLNQFRSFDKAALLDNAALPNYGKVLLTGNNNTAELYNPATNTLTATGNMSTSRQEHTATVLTDGTVLIAGGRDSSNVRLATAEIYDPTTGTFSPTAGPMTVAREQYAATRLNNGTVLLTGGLNASGSAVSSAEIYNPATKMFSSTGNMTTNRQDHAAVLLPSGKVLIAGGYSNSTNRSAELYDPATGTFASTAGSMVVQFRGRVTATLLLDGTVLLAGGQSGDVVNTAEIYNPATNAFSLTTGTMASKRYLHSATLLADGSALIAGGWDQQSAQSYVLPLATLERYIPATGMFVPAGSMETRRVAHTATRLLNDKVFLAGGSSQSWMTGNTGDLYDLSSVPSLTTTSVPDGQVGVTYPGATLAAGGGGGPPYQIVQASGLLPPGITYDANSFTLSGTPTANGLFPVGFRVTDSASHSNTQTLAIRVGTGIVITSPFNLTSGAVNHAYSYQLTATGAGSIVWSLAPASSPLPAGLSVNAGGLISGTPTTTGGTNFAIRAVDATGQAAVKTFNINIQSPLAITTTSVGDGVLFEGYGGCLNANNGVGTRTWIVTAGALPTGLSLQSNGCFGGSPSAFGAFNFTVQVTDQASPAQTDSKALSMGVSTAVDQNANTDGGQPSFSFGGPGAIKVAQHVTTGVTGTLKAVRLNLWTCVVGTNVTAQIQGLDASGAPDGNVLSFGTSTTTNSNQQFNQTIPLGTSLFFAADEPFAVVYSADQTCQIRPQSFDANGGGDAYVLSGASWQTLRAVDGRYDLPFATLVTPAQGLGFMTAFRGGHTATVLANGPAATNGKVLIAGGHNVQSAELYDPSTGLSTPTGNMSVARRDHTATLLDDGTVLITGGWNQPTNSPNVYLRSAELYHPDTGTFELLASTMSTTRWHHTATKLLMDARVLIVGGESGDCCQTDLNTAEFYSPGSRTFTAAATMTVNRREHTATRIPDGRVVVAGGWGSGNSAQSVDVFDPITVSFTHVAQTMSTRSQHMAALLLDGTVLLVGGAGDNGNALSTATIFDPIAGTFASAGSMAVPRIYGTATALANGSVLVAGGQYDNNCCNYAHSPQASMDRYVSGTTWTNAGSLLAQRDFQTASVLSNGKVLFTGSFGWSTLASRSVELYDPSTAVSLVSASAPSGHNGAAYPGFTLAGQGGNGGPYAITQAGGALPPGISYDSGTHQLSGSPTASGTFVPSFTVSDGLHANTQSVPIAIDPLAITSPVQLANAYQGQAYNITLTATGVGAITWTIINQSLPSGLTLSGNTISGTPTVSCCYYSFTLRATDSIGQTTTKSIAINVQSPLTITTSSLGDGIAEQTYGGCINWNNGSGPLTWSLSGQIPTGLALPSNSSCFDGSYPAHILRQTGTFTFTVTVTDSSSPPQTASHTYTIRVHGQDQQVFSSNSSPIQLPSTRRIAQTFTSSTPYDLTGVLLYNIQSCSANTQITAAVRPVTGAPARPDESGAPLGTASVTTNSGGFFNSLLTFSQPIPIPQHAKFAIVLSFANGSCQGVYFPTYDYYTAGDGLVNDGSSWQLLIDTLGVYDVPLTTLVMPTGLSFLSTYRSNPMSVTLQDGRVLLIGPDNTAEIYDPVTQTLTSTANNMSGGRWGATATLLSSGKVLVAGGQQTTCNQQGCTSTALASTEIFDPANGGHFSPGGNMSVGRYGHRATLVNGKVLATGGWTIANNGFSQTLQSADLLDASGNTTATLNMTGARVMHAATLLPNGKVLITGGWTGSPNPPTSAEIYDPAAGANGAFSSISSPMLVWRAEHTATVLTAGPHVGQVLIAGGTGFYPDLAMTSELFDPVTLQFSAAPGLNTPRVNFTATPLVDGRIVVAGGNMSWNGGSLATSSVEIYDPNANLFTHAGDLRVDRASNIAETLVIGPNQGKVFVAGGYSTSALAQVSAEIFDPTGSPLVITTVNLPDGSTGQTYPSTTLTTSGGSGTGLVFSTAWGTLPAGLTLDSSGLVHGTPNVGGPASFVVKVTDSNANVAYESFTIYVDRLTITSTSPLPNGVQGGTYNYQFTATGVGTIAWSLDSFSTLPPNLSLDPTTGLLSGSTPTAGYYFFTVRARDAANQIVTKGFSLQVETPLTITTTALDAGIVTWGYGGGCIQTSGGSYPRTFSITSGALPAGVTLDPNNGCLGTGTGSLTATSTSTFTVSVTDSANPAQVVSRAFTIRVGANDQNTGSFDQNQPALPFGNGIKLAQTFRQSLAGDLIAVLAPVACTPQQGAAFTIDIMPVDGVGRIVNSVLLSKTFDVSLAAPFSGGPYSRTFTFSSSVVVPLNIRLAAVFSSATASCSWIEQLPTNANQWTYAYGAGFKGTGGPVVWTPIAQDDQLRPNLPLFTVVDPNGALDFMSSGRSSHTATVLGNGHVLLAGGGNWGNSAQLYVPNARQFMATSPHEMVGSRQFHTGTTLQDGNVLIVGGRDMNTLQPLNTAEIYDPIGGTFTATGSLAHARFYHTATLLNDGRVLITGGNVDWGISLSSTEIYDPTLHTFSSGPTMITERAEHTATLVTAGPHNGDVLIVGGWGSPGNAERYTPGTPGTPGSVTLTTGGQPVTFHAMHTATRLLSGKVLIVGGWLNGSRTTSAETYDPASDSFTATGNLAVATGHHAAALLGDGRVLISGGDTDSGDNTARLELFNPAGAGTFSSANTMTVPRTSHTATLLGNGKVLLAGGYGPSNASWNSGELFDPAQAIVTIQNPDLPDGLRNHSYSVQLLGTGGATPYHFDFVTGTLPPNVTFNNGLIAGTPPNDNTATGTYYFAVLVTDSNNVSATQTLRLRIDPVDVTTVTLPGGVAGQPYSATLTGTGVGLTWSLVPNSGTLQAGLTLNANGTITGTPTQSGVVSFTVKATDAVGQTATRWLTIGVTPADHPPVAQNDSYTATENVMLNAPAPGVLANDTDIDSPTITAHLVANAAHGSVTLNTDGSFAYTPAANYTGSDSFTYKANDGQLDSNVATVTVTVFAAGTPTPLFNRTGPGTTMLSYFNPAPVPSGPPPVTMGFAAISFFNPAPNGSTPPPQFVSSSATASLSFFVPASPPQAIVTTTLSSASTSISFFSPVPPPVGGTPLVPGWASAPVISFLSGPPPAAGGSVTLQPSTAVTGVTFAAGPTVLGVLPTMISVEANGPSLLVLAGANLDGATAVTFSNSTGITTGAITVSADGRTLSVPITLAPSTPTGTIGVSVTTGSGSSPITAATFLTIIP